MMPLKLLPPVLAGGDSLAALLRGGVTHRLSSRRRYSPPFGGAVLFSPPSKDGAGVTRPGKKVAGPTRLELATSGVTGQRSNRLNYDP
jgi:hypothetical protein